MAGWEEDALPFYCYTSFTYNTQQSNSKYITVKISLILMQFTVRVFLSSQQFFTREIMNDIFKQCLSHIDHIIHSVFKQISFGTSVTATKFRSEVLETKRQGALVDRQV